VEGRKKERGREEEREGKNEEKRERGGAMSNPYTSSTLRRRTRRPQGDRRRTSLPRVKSWRAVGEESSGLGRWKIKKRSYEAEGTSSGARTCSLRCFKSTRAFRSWLNGREVRCRKSKDLLLQNPSPPTRQIDLIVWKMTDHQQHT